MPSRRLFVVRVGDPNGLWATWNPQNKWSTPEVPNGQLIRNAWVEGYEVHVLFVGTGDVPLHYGVVCGVRPRNPAMDANFPTRTEGGELQCFMLFETLINVRGYPADVFQPTLDEIRYTRGAQIPVSQIAAGNLYIFYGGFQSGQNTPRGAPRNDIVNINNTAIANPNPNTTVPIV
jgi:hypothetical protein